MTQTFHIGSYEILHVFLMDLSKQTQMYLPLSPEITLDPTLLMIKASTSYLATHNFCNSPH